MLQGCMLYESSPTVREVRLPPLIKRARGQKGFGPF